MEHVKQLYAAVERRLHHLAKTNAVVGTSVSVGDRHIVPLVELGIGLGGGGGKGEDKTDPPKKKGKKEGGGVGGGVKATPVAIIVIEDGDARVERIG